MEPSYYEGDHVLTFNWREPKVGDVIVFKFSTRLSLRGAKRRGNLKGNEEILLRQLADQNDKKGEIRNNIARSFFIKRINKIKDGLIYVSGDNKVSSSKIVPIKGFQIIGKVILKY